MKKFRDTESQNDYYWTVKRAKAIRPHKEKMLSLVDGDPLKLTVTLHDAPYDHYYVYMVDSLRVPDNPWMRYDFMIELDLREPNLGIYYGCRCVSEWESGHPFDEDIALADQHREELEEEIIRVLNATFPDKDFSHELRETDNANDYTYWPLWLSLHPADDIREIGVRALRLIRNVYASHLNVKPAKCGAKDYYEPEERIRTRFTCSQYRSLVKRIAYAVEGDEDCIEDGLRKFMACCEEKGWIEKDPILECGYRFRSCLGYSQSSGCAFMIESFMQYLNDKVGKKKGSALSVPWNAWVSLLLNSEGQPWRPDAIKIKIQKRYSIDIKKDNNKDKKEETLKEIIARIRNEIALMMEEGGNSGNER